MTPPPRPAHPYCRCFLAPITKSWDELEKNLKVKGPDPGTRPYTYTREKPPLGARPYASLKNKWAGDVPDAEKYPEWLKRMDGQDPTFVHDILRPTRYDLWKGGKVKFNEMVKNGKIISISQLKKRI